MQYIEELRQIIGHRPLIMVGAGILVTDKSGALLLGLRTDNHCWGIPGGAMEPGETLEETARRETLEETGLRLGELALFGVFSGPEFFYTYPNGDQAYNVSIIYQTSDYTGDPTTSPEHSTWDFFPPDHLPNPLSRPIQAILRKWSIER
jgi:8-oxo-dGTP pyrophosphatase MutT (NUDIX family)